MIFLSFLLLVQFCVPLFLMSVGTPRAAPEATDNLLMSETKPAASSGLAASSYPTVLHEGPTIPPDLASVSSVVLLAPPKKPANARRSACAPAAAAAADPVGGAGASSSSESLDSRTESTHSGIDAETIAKLKKPFEVGLQDGRDQAKICKNNRKFCLEFIETCNQKILEYSGLPAAQYKTKNLLYWAGVKLMFKTAMYETSNLIPITFCLEWAKSDGINAYHPTTYEHIYNFCCTAYWHAKKQDTVKARQMAEYWIRFERNLNIKKRFPCYKVP